MASLILHSLNIDKINIAAVNLLIKTKPGLSVTEYAKELAVSHRTLYSWIKKYKIEIPEKPYKCTCKKKHPYHE